MFNCRCLQKQIGESDNDWDVYLDPILFGIRTSVQASTKKTPFFLVYGREARLPLEVEKTDAVIAIDPAPELDRRIAQLIKIKEDIFPSVKSNIDKAQVKQKEQYSRRRGLSSQHISVGDTVMRLNMLKRTKKGHKTEDTWVGTYRVLEITDYGSCRLECLTTNTVLKRKINISQLKPYRKQDHLTRQPTNQGEFTSPINLGDKDHLADNMPLSQLTKINPVEISSESTNHPTELSDGQPTNDLADVNTKSVYSQQLSGQNSRAHHTNDADKTDANDELSVLEKELLNEDLFRLVLFESSRYSKSIVESDEKLNVCIIKITFECIECCTTTVLLCCIILLDVNFSSSRWRVRENLEKLAYLCQMMLDSGWIIDITTRDHH